MKVGRRQQTSFSGTGTLVNVVPSSHQATVDYVPNTFFAAAPAASSSITGYTSSSR